MTSMSPEQLAELVIDNRPLTEPEIKIGQAVWRELQENPAPGHEYTIRERPERWIWHDEVLQLADRYHSDGHNLENRAVALSATDPAQARELWAQVECYQQIYNDLCALAGRLNPQPGAGLGRPW
jgi:hypothetical protein